MVCICVYRYALGSLKCGCRWIELRELRERVCKSCARVCVGTVELEVVFQCSPHNVAGIEA